MKKIGIITIWQIGNYGAELQAYALQRKLNDLGFDSENIDYPFYKNRDFRITSNNRSPFPIGLKNRLKEFILPITVRFQKSLLRSKYRKREANFERFYQTTKHSSRRYLSMLELYNDKTLKYDVYIAGSDQIWNPRAPISLAPYFLTFAPETACKISYASSFGVKDIPESYFPQYQEWFSNLNHISVRETSGIKLVEDMTGRNATQVLDPTLLLEAEEWKSIAIPPACTQSYILLYDLLKSTEAIILAKHIAKEKGYRILRICRSAVMEHIDGVENIADAGPFEFLGLFMNASFVVTNSFHGTAFSIIFQQPFYTVIPCTMHNSSRIHSLLNLLELSHRQISAENIGNIEDFGQIDYSECQSRLKQAQMESLNFITCSIHKNDK